jgi:DNA-binding NtrC family response regulator
MKKRLEALINEMLDGQILLNEALAEFEKVFIERALERNGNHISKTADVLGVHRNTVAKRMASYNGSMKRRPTVKSKKH